MADYVGDFRRARECYLEATRYSGSTLTPLTTVLAHVNLAVALHSYVPRDALALARLSLQMADEMCATRSVTPPILNVLGYAFICNGEFDSAVTSLDSAQADAIRLGNPRTALYARFNTSILRELKGDLTGADDLLADVGASAPGSTVPSLAPWTTIRRAWLELLRGDAAKADRALAALERITGECYSDAIATLEALFAIQRGELGNARAELERQIRRALARDDRLTAFALLMWLVHFELEGGRVRAAEFAAERAHTLGKAGGFVLSPNWWDGRIVRSAMAVSNDARAVYFSGLSVPPERQRARRVAQIDDAGEIYLDGIPLSMAVWREGHSGSRLLRRLVAALAQAGEAGLTREEICDLIWPESEGDRAIRNFYAACNDLRRLLFLVPATRLVFRAGRYRLVRSGRSDDDRTRSMRAAATGSR